MSQNNPESSPLNSSEINKMKVLEWLSQSLDLKRLKRAVCGGKRFDLAE